MHRIEREYGTLYNEYTRVKRARKSVSRGARAAAGGGVGRGGAARGGAWGCKTCNENDLHPICTPYVSICLVYDKVQ